MLKLIHPELRLTPLTHSKKESWATSLPQMECPEPSNLAFLRPDGSAFSGSHDCRAVFLIQRLLRLLPKVLHGA